MPEKKENMVAGEAAAPRCLAQCTY